MNAGSVILLGRASVPASGLGPQRPTRMRAPLPPYPEPVDYKTVLPFTPPPGRALDFYRGQFCGLRIADAPIVPGCNATNPSCIMACLLDNYPAAIQDEFLALYTADGYTHLQRSLGHALHHGSSIADYIALSERARSFGLYCDHWFLSGPDEWPGGRDQPVAYWRQQLDPYIPRLIDAGVVDLACVGWQLDGYNVPGNSLIEIIKYIAEALPRTVPLYTHWINEALAWWKDGGEVWTDEYRSIRVHDRFTWWEAMQPYLTGGHHQGNTRMLCKEYQDRLCDTLDYFGDEHGRCTGKGDMGQSLRNGEPRPFALTVFECSAQDQFDDTPSNAHAISEAEGDQRGQILMCTTSPWGHLRGYGNGARKQDGAPL